MHDPLQTNDALITFPTALLNDKCDQFQFSLSVSSGDRKSSNAEMFLTISSGTNFRFVSDVSKLQSLGYKSEQGLAYVS